MNIQTGRSPAAEGHARSPGESKGLKLERPEGGRGGHSPDAVAGFPQNGSKTPLPWPAARTPSPTPAPTRRKLKSSEPGNCRLGVGGPAGAADQCVTAGAEARRVPGDNRESRAGHAGPRRPGRTLAAHPRPQLQRPGSGRGAPGARLPAVSPRTHAPHSAPRSGRPRRRRPGKCAPAQPSPLALQRPHPDPAREPRHGRRSTHLSFSMSAAEACEKPNERVSRREACAPWPRRAEPGTAGTGGRGGGAPPRGSRGGKPGPRAPSLQPPAAVLGTQWVRGATAE